MALMVYVLHLINSVRLITIKIIIYKNNKNLYKIYFKNNNINKIILDLITIAVNAILPAFLIKQNFSVNK